MCWSSDSNMMSLYSLWTTCKGRILLPVFWASFKVLKYFLIFITLLEFKDNYSGFLDKSLPPPAPEMYASGKQEEREKTGRVFASPQNWFLWREKLPCAEVREMQQSCQGKEVVCNYRKKLFRGEARQGENKQGFHLCYRVSVKWKLFSMDTT